MIVAFNYSAWVARYPEFSAVSSDLAQLYFDESCLYCDNTDASKITNEGVRTVLLNMLTAHIAALNLSGSSSNAVGRISSASEGSVSVSFDVGAMPGNAAWFYQTKYGMAYWQATSQYRTARIFPGRPRIMDPWARMRGIS